METKSRHRFGYLFLPVLFLTCLIVYFNFGQYFNEKNISIGVVMDSSDCGYVDAIEEAIEDIYNETGRRLILYKQEKNEPFTTEFKQLILKGEPNIIFYSGSYNDRTSEDQVNVNRLQPNEEKYLSALLSMINSSFPETENDIFLAPVMQDHEEANNLYKTLLTSGKMFPRVRLLTPVVFTLSNYTR